MKLNKAIQEYKKVAIEMLQYSFPGITREQCEIAVDYSIIKRCKDTPVTVNNNYKNKEAKTTLMDMADYILSREPIITMYGVMFKKHAEGPNPLAEMIKSFMDSRNELKKEMFKYPKGSDDFEKFNLLQLLAKIDVNGIYGALGQYSCMFYNIYVAASITAQGRAFISAAGLQFEMFLANNVKFMYFDEIICFIHNIINEKRNFKDSDFLDRDISISECLYKVMTSCGFIPTEAECTIVLNILSQLSQEDINRIYYKNNLYEFCSNESMKKAIVIILATLKEPFFDPNKPPKIIQAELDVFTDVLMEYVYYSHQIIDKYEKFKYMNKSVIIIQDTDSCIISLDAWFRFCLSISDHIDMEIKRNYYNPIEIIDNFDEHPGFSIDDETDEILTKPIEIVESDYDYDFYSDELVETQHCINPIQIIPEDNYRYSCINIIAYVLGKVINDYMINTTKGFQSYADGKKCLIIMKNEFLFRRLMSLLVKKNYADIIEVQEGNKVPSNKSLDTKGLSIDKSTLNDTSRKKFTEILYEDILKPNEIDQVKILKDLAIMEKRIFNSLSSGDKKYYKPLTVKSIDSYATPMQIQGIKASLVWNEVCGNLTPIDLSKRNSIQIVKTSIDAKSIESIRNTNPEVFESFSKLLLDHHYSPKIKAVAIPIDTPVPDWLLKFIDYVTIINDNLTNFPLDAVGMHKGKNSVNYTNILRL